ncbi:MAG: hypothetical protein E7361_02025 [Clostridiales bacterium]|nr:hypothetical protein [Clostridiales bacterium]
MANIVAKYIMEKRDIRQKAKDIWAEALKITDLENALYEVHSGRVCQCIQDEMYERSGKVREEIAGMSDKQRVSVLNQIVRLSDKEYKTDRYEVDIRNASRYVDIVFGEQMERE